MCSRFSGVECRAESRSALCAISATVIENHSDWEKTTQTMGPETSGQFLHLSIVLYIVSVYCALL